MGWRIWKDLPGCVQWKCKWKWCSASCSLCQLQIPNWKGMVTVKKSRRTVISIECFHMTSRRPYWCPKTMKPWPCWCPKPILWELNSFLMQKLSLVPINLHRCWPREGKHSILVIVKKKTCPVSFVIKLRWRANKAQEELDKFSLDTHSHNF